MRAILAWFLFVVCNNETAAQDEAGEKGRAERSTESRQLVSSQGFTGIQPLQHAGEDCSWKCWRQAGFCNWCGLGNACCSKYNPTLQPYECRGTVKFFNNINVMQCVVAAYKPGQALPPQYSVPSATQAYASKAQCIDYMSETGCKWTRQWNCPNQNAGQNGPAWNDGTLGYRCCCGLQLWMQDVPKYVTPTRQERAQCRTYMGSTGCSWTGQFNCPSQMPPGSMGQATSDGTLGFKCCCVFGFWEGFTGVTQGQQAAGYNPQEFGLGVGPRGNGSKANSHTNKNIQKKTWSQTPATGFQPTEHHGPIQDPASSNTHGACQFGICTDLSTPKSNTPYLDQDLAWKNRGDCMCKHTWLSAVAGCIGPANGCRPPCGGMTKPWCEVANIGCSNQVAGTFGNAWAYCKQPVPQAAQAAVAQGASAITTTQPGASPQPIVAVMTTVPSSPPTTFLAATTGFLAPTTLPPAPVVTTTTRVPARSSMSHAHKAGTNEVHVNDESKFPVGSKIVIGKGTDHEETVTVVGHGSLILSAPIKYDHDADSSVEEVVEELTITTAIDVVPAVSGKTVALPSSSAPAPAQARMLAARPAVSGNTVALPSPSAPAPTQVPTLAAQLAVSGNTVALPSPSAPAPTQAPTLAAQPAVSGNTVAPPSPSTPAPTQVQFV